jgi:hypothetical protein
MTKTLSAAVLTVLALFLSSCGGGASDSGDDARASQAISDIAMRQDPQGPARFVKLQRKEADCIGKGLVDKVGTEQLQKYGLLNEDLKPTRKGLTAVKMSPADAKAATGVVFGCTDVTTKAKAAIGKSGIVPKRLGSCVDRTLTERTLRTLFTKLFEGRQQDATRALMAPLTRCALGKSG